MKQRLKRIARRVLNALSSGSTKELRARVDNLERELDEYRRDSLRVAELMDLVEQQLTPGARQRLTPGAEQQPASSSGQRPMAGAGKRSSSSAQHAEHGTTSDTEPSTPENR